MLLGIFLGVLLGMLTGFIPGLNLGIFFLFAYNYGLNNSFLVFLFMTSAIINGLVSQTTLLTPVAQAADPALVTPMQKLIARGEGYKTVAHAYFSYASGVGFVLVAGLALLLTDHIYILGDSLEYISFSAVIAIIMWGLIIYHSENKLAAIIVLALVAITGWLTITKFPVNSMFIMATAIFGFGFGSTIKPAPIPTQDKSVCPKCYWSIHHFILGIVGGWLIGLPTSALVSALQVDPTEVNNPYEYKVANTALAQGASLGVSLILVLTNSGARDTASTYIDYLKVEIDPLQSIALLIIGIVLICLLCDNFEKIADFYLAIIQRINPSFIKSGILLLNLLTVLFFTGFAGIPLVCVGLGIGKLISTAKLPQGLSLGAISLIPIVALF